MAERRTSIDLESISNKDLATASTYGLAVQCAEIAGVNESWTIWSITPDDTGERDPYVAIVIKGFRFTPATGELTMKSFAEDMYRKPQKARIFRREKPSYAFEDALAYVAVEAVQSRAASDPK